MKFQPRTYEYQHPDHGSFFITHFQGKYCASRVHGPGAGQRCELLAWDAPSFGEAQQACLKRCNELDGQGEGDRHVATL